MRKVAIIGVGHVGSTTAYTLILKNIVDELVLFDSKEAILEAELNDLMDGQMEQEQQVRLIEGNLTELADTDVLIFCAGEISMLERNSDRFAELNRTKTIVEEWAPKIKASGFNGILLSITNPCDVITQYLQELTGLPRQRVLGTGTSLDTGRMKHAVSTYLNIHPSTIEGYVIGEHGESQFVAWSSVKINQQPITECLTPDELEKLNDAARRGGWITFTGKGYTSFGIATQTARIVEVLLGDQTLVVPISYYQESDNCYAGFPAKISRDGFIEPFPLMLSDSEQLKWQQTIQRIHAMYATIAHD